MIANFNFPDPRHAADHGLVALGGDYHPRRLLAAYAAGIFPWPSRELPYAWFSPNPRMVLRPADLHLPRSLRKTLRRGAFEVRFDSDFDGVIAACKAASRRHETGTWITHDLAAGFRALHRLGFAHSVETWRDGRLVGGLYGLALGSSFSGESMFFHERDASKVAFAALVQRLHQWSYRLIDCQVHTSHLARFGATEWPRSRFLDELTNALRHPTQRGSWSKKAG